MNDTILPEYGTSIVWFTNKAHGRFVTIERRYGSVTGSVHDSILALDAISGETVRVPPGYWFLGKDTVGIQINFLKIEGVGGINAYLLIVDDPLNKEDLKSLPETFKK